MGENTKIEWADHTASFWEGCVKVSPGCAHCYAESFEKRVGNDVWGKLKPRKWTKGGPALIRKLNKKAAAAGRIDTVFVNDLGDFFEDFAGPVVDHQGHRVFHENFGYTVDPEFPAQRDNPCLISDLRADAFPLFDQCQNLIFMLLTKRPENVLRMWCSHVNTDGKPPSMLHRPNVWLGTSIENQEQADKRIPELLKCRDLSPVLFLSCEPLLGPLEFSNVTKRADAVFQWGKKALNGIDWVIVGGESGPGARPLHPDWARSIRDQCVAVGVPLFFKQWGEWQNGSSSRHNAAVLNNGQFVFPDTIEGRKKLDGELGGRWDYFNPVSMSKVGKASAGRILDGREWNEMPEVTNAPTN